MPTRTTRSRLAAFVTVCLVMGAAAAHVATQGRGTGATSQVRTPPAPRVPAGQPDLQGTWNFSSLTPLERPAEFAGRATLSPAEAAAFEQQLQERNNADRRDGGVDADVARAYNDSWYDRGTHLAVVNGAARTSLITDPPDGRVPALTPAAQARQAARLRARREHPADGPEDRSLGERCLSFNAGPPMLPGPYNNYVQVFQFRSYVVIVNEMIHDARIVPTDGRPHAPASFRRPLGDSVGRWDGNALVVDTTNFTETTPFRGSSGAMHLVERFTRVNASTLLYEFTVNDPTSFTRPWSAAVPMQRTDEQIFEYACHEGNHAMVGILGGARFEEKNRK